MNIKKSCQITVTLLGVIILACACSTTGNYMEAANIVTLDVHFADPNWNGKRIPDGQQCLRFGGNGSTPRLIVSNIPSEANALIFEYSDRDYLPMANGGHGKIGFRIPKETQEVIVPSVPGHTFDLPDGFFLVSAHRKPDWDKAGAYMPPCSGGRGNLYYVTVKAVTWPANQNEKPILLGKGKLILGVY
ncbi:hypothetical protein SAMN02745206_03318 [Desulfacinum infernum DSM 9756]|uniref:Spondin_N n=1 Tax=Desulfacinum infernum DSM 9756 TaxID=1121391 RepID=A0A1M5HAE0_9BACT|nr:hypothetical protein [Desulfacinum infernum]SHG12949.1 hypothetical protein SAMN02745206_03318 [Desulfacinum infernum DSM 9756]